MLKKTKKRQKLLFFNFFSILFVKLVKTALEVNFYKFVLKKVFFLCDTTSALDLAPNRVVSTSE